MRGCRANGVGNPGGARNGGGEEAAGGGKKLSPVESGVFARLGHVRLLGERSKAMNTNIFKALYDVAGYKQAGKSIF